MYRARRARAGSLRSAVLYPQRWRQFQMDDESRGKVDLTSILYIVGGIPALVAVLVIVFSFTHACNIPA